MNVFTTRWSTACVCAAALFSLSGCQSLDSTRYSGDEVVAFELPYQYESLGAGNEGVLFPTVPFEKEAEFFSVALIDALQDLEYSIVKPSLSGGPLLPEGVPIETDAVPVPVAVVNEHNRSSDLAPILLNATYRLSYEIVYGVNKKISLQQKHFWLHVRSILERRGAGGQWHPYPQPYSGRFFGNVLRQIIQSKFQSIG